MPNIEQKLALATRITTLRAELAAAEREFAGEEATRPGRPGNRPGGPSVSQRVLHLIVNAGAEGLTRQDLRSVIVGQEGAVTAAVKAHATAGRIASVNGRWVATERARAQEQATTAH